jgi:hypothetical protein
VCLKLEEPLGKKAVCFGLTGGVRGTAGPARSGSGHGACWTVLCAVHAACCSERSEEGEERWAEKRALWGSRERKYERERDGRWVPRWFCLFWRGSKPREKPGARPASIRVGKNRIAFPFLVYSLPLLSPFFSISI